MTDSMSASPKLCLPETCHRPINRVLRVLLLGARDVNSDLHVLAGVPHILRQIWQMVDIEYRKCVLDLSHLPEYACGYFEPSQMPIVGRFEGGAYFRLRSAIDFPEFSGINVNMMPFIMARNFEDSRLPAEYESYFDSLIGCCIAHMADENEKGKIGFLTIHESEVPANQAQRRPGIHTEKSRSVHLTEDNYCVPQEILGGEEANLAIKIIKWGRGRGIMKGGIFMATNLENSSRIWNCKITEHPDGDEMIGPMGDISHLEHLLPEGKNLEANRIYWLTDRTPHESLPLQECGRRQFFRVVTSEVSVWYQDHSTPNPTGLLPDPAITTIVRGSKFPKRIHDIKLH